MNERRLAAGFDAAFEHNPNPELALSLACVVVQHGEVVAERYGPGIDASTPLISWSTAKSITHALVGLAVGDGVIDIDAPVQVPAWSSSGDPRATITLRHLLAMRSGLEFNEDYVDAGSSHCIEMLFGDGAQDMASYAAGLPLAHPVDSAFNYSSGTTNIVSRIVADAYGFDPDPTQPGGMQPFLEERLFGPLGMATATATFDTAGTFVGSSYVHASARDFARFGALYLGGGVSDGRRLLPDGWTTYAATPTSHDPETGLDYGAHWWVWDDEYGTYAAQGYEGQLIAVVPALDAVVVRLGKTPIQTRPALFDHYRDLIAALA